MKLAQAKVNLITLAKLKSHGTTGDRILQLNSFLGTMDIDTRSTVEKL
jgi:hypothetical protein